MTDNDKCEFFELLTAMAEAFNQEVSAMKGQIYWLALRDLPLETVRQNANSHIRTSKFFPSASELRQDDSTNDRAILAWAAVEKAMHTAGYYYSVQFDDRAIHSVIRAMGGWMNLNQEQAENMPFRRKEFIETYAVMSKRDGHPEYLYGFTENQNRASGFTQYIPKPKQITTGYITPERQLEAHDADNGHAIQRHA